MNRENFTKCLLVTLGLIILGCNKSVTSPKPPSDNSEKVTIKQGVWGNVEFWDGNFMPTTDYSSDGTVTPVVRDIYVYEATRFDSLGISRSFGFWRNIPSKLITTARSDGSGFFQVELAAGKYSFFVLEDSLYYANLIDSDGHVQSATVTLDHVTRREININYRACW